MSIIFAKQHSPHSGAASIRHRARSGELIRLHPGVYFDATSSGKPSAETLHAARTFAVARNSPTAVISGVSAANLYRLPLLQHRLNGRVMVTRQGHGRESQWVQVRRSELPDSHVTTLFDVRVTSLPRTIRDLAEYLPPFELLAVVDAALRQGLDLRDLPREGRNARKFRWLAEHASDRSESFAESWSRAILIEHGLPTPLLQVSIYDEVGTFAGRSDLGWPDLGALGEFDGGHKYGQLLRPGETAQARILAEKEREHRIRSLGWELPRWQWSHLQSPKEFVASIETALDRAARQPAPRGSWRIEQLRPVETGSWLPLFGPHL